jgi:DNA repair protein RadC
MGLRLSFITRDGLGAMTIQYTQAESSEQMTLLGEEHTTKPKQAGVPIYRVVLVKEGKFPTYESRIRSSANAHTVLQEYMDGADCEMFVEILLDRKNGLIGLNLVSVGSLTGSVVHPREVLCAVCAVVLYRYQR